MESRREKSPRDTGRQIRWLAVIIFLVAIAYSGGWFWLADKVEAYATAALDAQRAKGNSIDCPGRAVTGYPFRFEVRCASIAFEQPAREFSIEAGAFRSAAQVYEPRRIIAELDSPMTVLSPVLPPLRIEYDLAQTSAVVAEPLPQRASAAIDRLRVSTHDENPLMTSTRFEIHMRQNGDALDLAVRFEGLAAAPPLAPYSALPPLSGDADVTIKDGVALASGGVSSLRGVSGELRRGALLVTPEKGVMLNGPFSIGADGLVDATLELSVVDPAGLAAAFKPVFPQYAAQIEALASVQPPSDDGSVPEVTLPVAIRDGMVRLGFFALGDIPPID
ncbi:DUF2125 domain-containing protein [Oricola cellulosilytica]|uniref:DUF2125 domain-containing protein n=1 Tax=Oricola cellulosilytica TaxID=1429082 RepID=A0A4R0PEG6_9HYPH|nr:DUF2125 domain-containing protein [Oricola cellulosilytica]TCD13763.1 DUF2125 domain-containing protein [Oricola cellulosilytica]